MKLLEKLKQLTTIQKNIFICIVIVVLVGSFTVALILHTPKDTESNFEKESETLPEQIVIEIPDEEDPQSVVEEIREEEAGAESDIRDVVEWNPPSEVTLGIDVSKYQGKIDWKKVAQSGIQFAMIRIGHRTLVDGTIVEDKTAKYNLQEATKYGIHVGAYFFSTAVNRSEILEEVDFVCDIIEQYSITYPVAYDCEGFSKVGNRQYSMSIEERTEMAVLFMDAIAERGYSPIFYGSKSDMQDDLQWDVERLSSYNIWVAQYPAKPYPETSASSYIYPHMMWQYTSKGKVPGIQGNVDMNVAYFGYEESAPPSEETPDEVSPNPEAGMTFEEVNEKVTAKIKTNLRSIPSQGEDSEIMHTLLNGEVVVRTGVSSTGWSRVVYEGNIYYAISSYLTTDLQYQPPVEDDGDGIQTKFEATNVRVTAKEVVNLREKPSVDDAVGPVVLQLKAGDVAVKTGVSTNGWARVEYQGKVLYCIDSYLKVLDL